MFRNDPTVENLTIGSLVVLFDADLAGTVATSTRVWYQRMIKSLVDHLGSGALVSSVTNKDLKLWRRNLVDKKTKYGGQRPTVKDGLKDNTINGYVRVAKRFFNWCVAEGYVDESPAEGLKMNKVGKRSPKAISRTDRAKMLDEAKRSSARDYAIVRLLADSGARSGGILNLTYDDQLIEDLERGWKLTVEKGDKQNAIYFTKETAAAIRAYLKERPKSPHPALFLNSLGNPMTNSNLHKMLDRLASAAGVTGRYNPHSFRHAFARDMIIDGCDLGRVSRILGHSNSRITTDYYAVFSTSELSEAHRQFSPLRDTTN